MNMLNQIIFEGKVYGEVKVRNLPNGFKVASVYVRNERKNRERTEVVTVGVDAYGNLADAMEGWASDGRSVRIVGRLRPVTIGETIVILAEHLDFNIKEVE